MSNTQEQTVAYKCTCPGCGKTENIYARPSDYSDWQAGALIQNAFPYLTVDEREQIKTGYCPDCWDKLFDFGF